MGYRLKIPTPTYQEDSFITIKVRTHAAILTILTTFLLTCLKFAAAHYSGSVSLLSESIHSFLDLASSIMTFFAVREAIKPADKEHPFGHGKLETLSSLFESFLLLGATFFIVQEAISSWLHPQPIQYQPAAILVLLFSLILSFFMYRSNLQTSLEVDSQALESNAYHFFADFASNIAVLIGFILMRITPWQWIDPLIAFGVACYLAYLCIPRIFHNIQELIDNRLPNAEIEKIVAQINLLQDEFIQFYYLRTRKSGSNRHIDFHLMLCGAMPVFQAHQICDRVEEKIKHVFQNTSINIHIEPCLMEAHDCHKACLDYKKLIR